MRINHAGSGVESQIRNSGHAHIAVVSTDVLHQPVDRVPRVGAFIERLGIRLGVEMRTDVDKRSLRGEPTPDVLQNEDELLVHIRIRQVPRAPRSIHRVGLQVVGRALEQDRILRSGSDVLRREHHGVQLHAVAHRDAVFVLGVALGKGVGLRLRIVRRNTRSTQGDPKEYQK